MKVYDAPSIRNVALVGHSGAGKTQLTSALLFGAGAVNRFGRVDDGTTVTDYDEEEITRKHTLSCSLAFAEWNKHKINIIDTPGMSNFLSDSRAALRVADAALVVIDAVSRRRGVDREDVDHGAGPRGAAHGRAQSARSRARQPGAVAGLAARPHSAARSFQCSCRSAKNALQRRRRPGDDDGVDVRRRERQAVRGRGARRYGRRRRRRRGTR